MPKPNPDESEKDFVDRCIPMVMGDGAAENSDQAVAMCHSIFKEHNKDRTMANTKPLSKRTVRMDLRAPVSIEAGAEGKQPSFEAVAYSGGRVPGYTANPPLDLDYVIDLSQMKLHRNIVANLDHEPHQRVGHVTDVDNDTKQLKVRGLFSAATPHKQEVVDSAKNGHPWEVSQEGELGKFRLLAAGKKEIINGQEQTGPIYIARSSRLTGVAFVSQGADEGNRVTIAASAAKKETQMDEFEKWLVSKGIDLDDVDDNQKSVMKLAYDAEKAGKSGNDPLPDVTAKDGKDGLTTFAAAQRKENHRVETIMKMTAKAIREYPAYIDGIEDMGKKAIESKMDPERFELELLRGLRPATTQFKTVSRPEPDNVVMEAALCLAAGLPNIEKVFKPETLEAVDKHGMRHFSLQQILIRAAVANGYDARPGESITQGNLREILEYAFPPRFARIQAASGFSTINLPGVFGSVANKEILAGFTEEDQSWQEVSVVKSVSDFKTMTSYRLTDSLEYEELPKGGEIKHGRLGEESYTRSIKTYAKMLGLDRQDIINDDLSAFDDLRTRLGRGAARKFNNVFWTRFLNNSAFFTTARGNYIEGATTNLGTDGVGLTAGVTQFGKMLSADGKRIGGRPTILLVPPELEVTADKLYTGGGADAQTVANTNPFKGKYRPVVVPWLSDSAFTGYSTTAWYLFRQASILAPMVVSFLNGQRTPTVESTDADFDMLGILFRGYHDFGADLAEYLAGLKSKGAA